MVYPTGHTKNLRNAKISNLSNEILQKESSEKLEENQQQSNKNLPRTGQHDIPQSLLKARIMEENKG